MIVHTTKSPRHEYPFYRLGRLVSGSLRPLLFSRQVWGRRHVPQRGGVILLSNHQSYLDPLLIGLEVARECHYMARASLFQNRCFRRLITTLNAFPLDRDGRDLTAVKEAVRRVTRGHVLCLFGEGTRSPDGRIAPLQRGVVLVARRAAAPIVPVVLDGLFELWPRGRRWPRRGPYRIAFGPPLGPQVLHGSSAAVTDRLTTELRALQNRVRRQVGRPPVEY